MGAIEDMRQIVFRVTDERDAARAEVERLKTINQEVLKANYTMGTTRPEPSRLEIAMRFAESAWQNRQISEMRTSDQMRWALARADALIGAAKEGK
jgi:hypothetical protein